MNAKRVLSGVRHRSTGNSCGRQAPPLRPNHSGRYRREGSGSVVPGLRADPVSVGFRRAGHVGERRSLLAGVATLADAQDLKIARLPDHTRSRAAGSIASPLSFGGACVETEEIYGAYKRWTEAHHLAGGELHEVQATLGHTNITMTSTYLNATTQGVRGAFKKLEAKPRRQRLKVVRRGPPVARSGSA